MATIRKRGKRWQAQVRINGRAASKSFGTRREAVSWSRDAEIDLARKINGGLTLADAVERYKSEVEHDQDRATKLTYWVGVLGDVPLEDLRKRDFVEGRSRLMSERDLKPATINRYMAAISAVLTRAVEDWFLIESNPARIRSVREDNARDRVLAPPELEALIRACEASEDRGILPFVLVALGSGCRAGELTQLRWRDVDLDKGLAVLRNTKNRDTRTIPIQGYALDCLKGVRGIGNAFVFRNPTGKTPYDYYRAWDKVRRAAGISNVRFHDLRHHAASTLAMSGKSLGEIGALLGHRSPAMTQRYSHYLTEHTLALGDVLAIKTPATSE